MNFSWDIVYLVCNFIPPSPFGSHMFICLITIAVTPCLGGWPILKLSWIYAYTICRKDLKVIINVFFFLRQGFVFDNSLCNLEVGAIVSGIILLEI